MMNQKQLDYNRIAEAIKFITTNFKNQPNLDTIAEKVHLSPYHFQRLFTEWAGTSPKRFLQYISLDYAKKLLKENEFTLFETAHETGLSSTGRLHDLFINIEGMTPAEFKNGGKGLEINYSFADCPFGKIIIASTKKGICFMAFYEDKNVAFTTLVLHFPNALFTEKKDTLQENALNIFSHDTAKIKQLKLHIKGTGFQLKVWETLLRIPYGKVASYGMIADEIERPKAARAVGTAIGSNPVAFLIPCHRVIQSTGAFGGYMWGNVRKKAIIGWEATKLNEEINMQTI